MLIDTLIIKYLYQQGITLAQQSTFIGEEKVKKDIEKTQKTLESAKIIILQKYEVQASLVIHKKLLGRKIIYPIVGNINKPKNLPIRALLASNIIIAYEYC